MVHDDQIFMGCQDYSAQPAPFKVGQLLRMSKSFAFSTRNRQAVLLVIKLTHLGPSGWKVEFFNLHTAKMDWYWSPALESLEEFYD